MIMTRSEAPAGLKNIVAALQDARNIALIAHLSPDGDALGSCFALALALQALGKRVNVLCDHTAPNNLRVLGAADLLCTVPEEGFIPQSVMAVDCADAGRMGQCARYFDAAPKKLMIDHHASNPGFGELFFVDTGAAATGEIVYDIVQCLGMEMTRDIAGWLYVAIASDTGNFAYSNTSQRTFAIMADLMRAEFDLSGLNRALFRVSSAGRMRLIGACLVNLILAEEGRLAFSLLDYASAGKLGLQDGDSNGVIDYLRDIDGVELAILVRQSKDNEYKVSLRSNTYVDVNAIASRWGGGGHLRAAGCVLRGEQEQVTQEIIGCASLCVQAPHFNGVINILKPPGMTSSDVVTDVRRALNIKKVGHAGTLDPGAAGVLPICVGKATRLFDYLTDKSKEYLFEIHFGMATDTLDAGGVVTQGNGVVITEQALRDVLPQFLGQVRQTPPMYSAIKVEGYKMYELARQGKSIPDVVKKARDISIYELELLEQTGRERFMLRVRCSRGTYVRVLCEDIAKALGTIAYVSFLMRVKSGPFQVENSVTLDELYAYNEQEKAHLLFMPMDMALRQFPAVNVENYYFKKLVNGAAVPVELLQSHIEENEVCRVYCAGSFFGLGKRDKNLLRLSCMLYTGHE